MTLRSRPVKRRSRTAANKRRRAQSITYAGPRGAANHMQQGKRAANHVQQGTETQPTTYSSPRTRGEEAQPITYNERRTRSQSRTVRGARASTALTCAYIRSRQEEDKNITGKNRKRGERGRGRAGKGTTVHVLIHAGYTRPDGSKRYATCQPTNQQTTNIPTNQQTTKCGGDFNCVECSL